MSEFIGKRIVPVHEGVWDQKKNYEMLAIVRHEESGDSYISRRDVPAGTALTDTAYWMLHSVYSQQIADAERHLAEAAEDVRSRIAASEEKVAGELADTEKTVEQKTTAAENLTNANKTELNRRMDGLDARLNANVTASTEHNADYAAEVVDARVDCNGKENPSLGEAIRHAVRGLDDRKQDCLGHFQAIEPFESTEDTLYNGKARVEFKHAGSMYSKYLIPEGTTLVQASGYQYVDKQYSPCALLDSDGKVLSFYEGEELGYVTVVVSVPEDAKYAYVNGRIGEFKPQFRCLEKADPNEVLVIPERIDTIEDDIVSLSDDMAHLIGFDARECSFDIIGYVDVDDGSYHNFGGGKYMCTDFIRVTKECTVWYDAAAVAKVGLCFYDKDKEFISGTKNIPKSHIMELPDKTAYIRAGTDAEAKAGTLLVSLDGKVHALEGRIEKFEEIKPKIELVVGVEKHVYSVAIEGYVDYEDGTYHKYGNGDYLCSDFIPIVQGLDYHAEVTVRAKAGVSFYDADMVYLSGVGVLPEDKILKFPDGAKYVRVSDYVVNGAGTVYSILNGKLNEIDERLTQLQKDVKAEILDGKHRITINCFGDSVTEGMALNGAHYARYGESPFPARLQTILTDNGYGYVTVCNCGHGGERTADIAARLGGLACYVSEKITIPADNQKVSLGTMVKESGHVAGTKLKVPYPDGNGKDYCVYITQTSHDTNPVWIDGVKYTMTVSDGADWIAKTVADGVETVIPEGSFFFTANNRGGAVNILYSGINDGNELTFKRWADMTEACGAVNGGKYIVLGCTHSLFERWSDIEGMTSEEKYKDYRKKCMERFGFRFIDLYDEFSRHGVDYAIAAGYFQDVSKEEIQAMRDKLSAHTIPGKFCYNGSEGDVHLSEAGYHVIAMLIFERLKLLSYI